MYISANKLKELRKLSGFSQEELAEAAFFRGEASFWMGRYTDTVEFLTKSIGMKKNREYEYLDIQAYNVLGMVFSFVGYETVALTNYLQAAKTAEKNQDIEKWSFF